MTDIKKIIDIVLENKDLSKEQIYELVMNTIDTTKDISKDTIVVYTDGSSLGNPGPGGWGYVCVENNIETYSHSGSEAHSTNNKMELTAAIEGLEYTKENNHSKKVVNVYTDSNYVKNGITKWIINWKKNGWKTKQGKDVMNKDLWVRLDSVASKDIEWKWVKAHNGNYFNEKVDELAREAAIRISKKK